MAPKSRPPAAPAEASVLSAPQASRLPNRLPNRLQMADLARIAGVSVSTVSRALNHSPLLNADTRDRILALARDMNYSINVAAQNLRLKQNRTVAVIVPYDARTRQHLSDPFFLSLIGGLADALTARGHDMLLTRVDAEHLDAAASPWQSGRASGVVMVGQWHHHDQLNEMADSAMPFVVWGAQMAGQRYATVGGDNREGGRLATAHLIERGARHVLFFGDPELPEIGQRCEGWRAAHRAARRALPPDGCRPVPFVAEAIEAEIERLVVSRAPFDAIFAASDLMAMTVISTLRRLGRRVPEDVQVVGYDDIALAAHFVPPLSTVRQPIEAAGEALVELLLAQLAGEARRSALLPTELIVRQSTLS
jgi:DNA-binding LacI/PurR family transcriptional regulator